MTFDPPLNFLPGPVPVDPTVLTALARPAISHRSAEFRTRFEAVRERLLGATGSFAVEILVGSGTLANEAVAAQLVWRSRTGRGGRGLIPVLGEFGGRLADQARRVGLEFESVSCEWGETLDLAALERRLARGEVDWLWTVHCETSTGVLVDLAAVSELCSRFGVVLAVDAISSIGNVPLNLSRVDFASATSGKGLAALPGLALVFHRGDAAPIGCVPRALDLALSEREHGVPFTISSNLVGALDAALEVAFERLAPDVLARRNGEGRRLFDRLAEMGCRVLPREDHWAPWVLTFRPPLDREAFALGEALERRGVLLSYRSGYLVERGLLQVCRMGERREGEIESLTEALGEALLDSTDERRPT